ncbi:MAG: response regulator [Bacteroidia bacterium]|nr:MAG: response regulator [Bacteroidia bacterium]
MKKIEKDYSYDSRRQPEYDWNNRVVLITEDEEVNFFYLKTLLQKADATVIRAKNGKEAVDIITRYEGAIDLILMDLNMPVMDGYEAMRIIKSKHPSIPIIAQTAYTMNNDRHKCLEAGFNDYIAKPINRLALYRMVNENLS